MGASKVCAVIFSAEGELSGLAVAPVPGWPERPPSRAELASLVRQAVSEADAMAGHRTRRAWFSLSGKTVRPRLARAVVRIASTERRVSRSDLERAMAAAVQERANLLHQLLASATLDGREILEEPVGRTGERLEVCLLLVEAAGERLAELGQVAAAAGLEAAGFVAGALAAASVLTPAEREVGTAVVELGATHTSMAVYVRGKPRHLGAVGLGSLHLTKDLAIVLGLPLAKAERIKLEALAPGAGQDLPATPAGKVIAARLGETLELVRAELAAAGWAGRLPGGYVLTGGGAPPEGLLALARETLGAPVRLGLPGLSPGGQGMLAGPAYAVTLGLRAVVREAASSAGVRCMPKGVGRWRSWFPRRRSPT